MFDIAHDGMVISSLLLLFLYIVFEVAIYELLITRNWSADDLWLQLHYIDPQQAKIKKSNTLLSA